MSVKTIQRHLKQNTKNVVEGSVDVFGLKKYLIDNEFPLAVCLCEDGTRITAGVQYDYTTDSLRGLVAPLNENGLPQTGLFTASSPYKIAQMIKDYPTGNHVYVQMALPLAAGAAPFVLYHACSDNKFDATDVLNRWRYTEMVLREQGINVVANASDGDPRLMKAMKERSCLRNNYSKSTWGWWYSIEDENNSVLNVQDMIHGINKIRNRLMRGDLKIGKFKVSTSHLKELIQNHSKDKHRLSMSDIDLKDKMKFGPSLKMIDKDMINYLKQHVRQSSGTVLLLNVMRLMHNSFVDENFVPLDRVHDVW
ncbi:uncharacterized protein LOC134291845 [Aedes albopictus]|uniref:Uncharacterized protein n=1 Tax=Aedes albopictus TaxID=7160 RepID=A0ABM2A5S9_AEDAL